MNVILQKLLQTPVEPRQEAEWPPWIAEALAYKPESSAPVVDALAKAPTPATEDRRNLRVLTRVSNP